MTYEKKELQNLLRAIQDDPAKIESDHNPVIPWLPRLAAAIVGALMVGYGIASSPTDGLLPRGLDGSVGRLMILAGTGLIILALIAARRSSHRIRSVIGCLAALAGILLIAILWRVGPPDGSTRFQFTRPTYALFVGVSGFADPTIGDLPLVDDGTRRLRDAFAHMSVRHGGDVRMLLDGEATLARIRREIKKLFEDAYERSGDSAQVVIYVGTHGVFGTGPREVPYFVTFDTTRDDYVGTALSFTDLRGLIEDYGTLAHRVLLIADVCHAGALGPRFDRYLETHRYEQGAHAFAVVMASGASEEAFDVARLGASALVHELDRGLVDGHADRAETDGTITVHELVGHLITHVPRQTKLKQTPTVRLGPDGPVDTRASGEHRDSRCSCDPARVRRTPHPLPRAGHRVLPRPPPARRQRGRRVALRRHRRRSVAPTRRVPDRARARVRRSRRRRAGL